MIFLYEQKQNDSICKHPKYCNNIMYICIQMETFLMSINERVHIISSCSHIDSEFC